MSHVLTFAVFFTFLRIALVAARFRKRRVQVALTMAGALADSDMPQNLCENETIQGG